MALRERLEDYNQSLKKSLDQGDPLDSQFFKGFDQAIRNVTWVLDSILEETDLQEANLALDRFLPQDEETTAPRPEDVPVGEPWQVEVYGKAAIGYRNYPEDRLCWAALCRDEAGNHWASDSDVTLIARLVPETSEEPEFDTAYLYRDNDGDVWEFVEGKWITGPSPEEREEQRELYPGHDSLPDMHGPYTRVEEAR